MSTSRFSPAGRTYIWGVILTGLAIIIWSLYAVYADGTSARWLVFAALTAISSSAGVGLIAVPASLSVSDTFVFAALLLYGPAAGTLTVAIDGLVASSCMSKATRRPDRMLFNVSAPTIAVWSAAEIFFAIGGFPPTGVGSAPLNSLLAPFALCAVSYFLMNSGLIATAVAFEAGVGPTRIWRRDFAWLSINHFAAASLALLLVASTRYLNLIQVMLLAPVLMVVYFTLKTTMDRVRDSNDHLIQVNRLYLSTIEALAMAIDAKDQVTHGHIRRVQTYAIGLARKLGVKDEGLIKAIEAAALLHDTGKIAIPEHILNKPGRLTAAEFERMKTHAGIGADILSEVDFPFPVVPIVRHHHENWDGTGYPDGIGGIDIPIGARILSVVDCFDALTSDRPYRRAMSEAEANEILLERRGRMYDPLVVDTFIEVQHEIAPDAEVAAAPLPVMASRTDDSPPNRVHEDPQVRRAGNGKGATNEAAAAVLTLLDLAAWPDAPRTAAGIAPLGTRPGRATGARRSGGHLPVRCRDRRAGRRPGGRRDIGRRSRTAHPAGRTPQRLGGREPTAFRELGSGARPLRHAGRLHLQELPERAPARRRRARWRHYALRARRGRLHARAPTGARGRRGPNRPDGRTGDRARRRGPGPHDRPDHRSAESRRADPAGGGSHARGPARPDGHDRDRRGRHRRLGTPGRGQERGSRARGGAAEVGAATG